MSNPRFKTIFRHNKNVSANREVLRTSIDATCFLPKKAAFQRIWVCDTLESRKLY